MKEALKDPPRSPLFPLNPRAKHPPKMFSLILTTGQWAESRKNTHIPTGKEKTWKHRKLELKKEREKMKDAAWRSRCSSPSPWTEEAGSSISRLRLILNEGKWKNIQADVFNGAVNVPAAANITSRSFLLLLVLKLPGCPPPPAACRRCGRLSAFDARRYKSQQHVMGAAERLIMQNRRVRAGREWQRKHFWTAHERTVVCLHPETPAARGASDPPPNEV